MTFFLTSHERPLNNCRTHDSCLSVSLSLCLSSYVPTFHTAWAGYSPPFLVSTFTSPLPLCPPIHRPFLSPHSLYSYYVPHPLVIIFLPNILFSLNSPLGTNHRAYLAVWSLFKCYFIGSTSMEAIRKQASKLREQVAKQQQVYIKAFSVCSLTRVFRMVELCFFLGRFCLVRVWYCEESKRRSRFLFLGICGYGRLC